MRLLHDRTLRPSLKYKNRYGARAPDRLSELSVVALSLSLCVCRLLRAAPGPARGPAHTPAGPGGGARPPRAARRGDTGEPGGQRPASLRLSARAACVACTSRDTRSLSF